MTDSLLGHSTLEYNGIFRYIFVSESLYVHHKFEEDGEVSMIFVSVFFSGMLFLVRWAHMECARKAGEAPDQCFIASLGFVAWAFLATAAVSGILALTQLSHPEIFGSLIAAACYGTYGFRRDRRWIHNALPVFRRAKE